MSAYEWNQQVPLNQQQNSVDHTQEYNFYEDNNKYDASADHNNTSNVHEEQLITPKKGFEELLEEKLSEDVQKVQAWKGTTKNVTKKTTPEIQSNEFTPLRIPDLKIKHKTPLKNRSEWNEESNLGMKWTSPQPQEPHCDLPNINAFNGLILTKINEIKQQNFQKPDQQIQSLSPISYNSDREESELRKFECLERKMENSSFCSTDSSVLRILSSTPHKTDHLDCTKAELEMKLRMLRQKTQFVNNFMYNIRNKAAEDTTTTATTTATSTLTRFDSESECVTDDETYEKCEKTFTDACVNTSESNSIILPLNCLDCVVKDVELNNCKNKIESVQQQLQEQIEIVAMLRKRNEEVVNKMEEVVQEFDVDKKQLLIEIDELKTKLIKEKAQNDSLKTTKQNVKKDREELDMLKDELIETKELIKLKEAKNGMTQARLRTRIKNLEKENGELKDKVELLTKQNAKLSFGGGRPQRKSADLKLLQDINKTLNKLTEDKTKETGPKSVLKNGKKSEESQNFDGTTFENLSLEEQYRSVFSPGQHKSFNDSKKGKIETVFEDGTKEVRYSNGNVKTVSPDGQLATIKYYNGDIKQTFARDNTIKYYYANNNIWHTTFADGTENIEFPSGQIEKRYPDGRSEVFHPDGTVQCLNPDGSEETRYSDGSMLKDDGKGTKTLLLANGQREIHTKSEKRREYPDGTVKILYLDGSQETRYASGRIRKKDPEGNLVYDSNDST
ncbi:centromere protein J isoform X2 [Aethina tumida]|uniref:centromere protein J isoform X2 n=1 Tax=Aethina tumida TaxID=116153 RepID=UPI002147D217|nr:centromere protein J isoform X2 [Aethina tumida]